MDNSLQRVRMLNIYKVVKFNPFGATFTWGDGKDKEHGVSEEQDAGGVKRKVVFSYHIGNKNITIITTKHPIC